MSQTFSGDPHAFSCLEVGEAGVGCRDGACPTGDRPGFLSVGPTSSVTSAKPRCLLRLEPCPTPTPGSALGQEHVWDTRAAPLPAPHAGPWPILTHSAGEQGHMTPA